MYKVFQKESQQKNYKYAWFNIYSYLRAIMSIQLTVQELQTLFPRGKEEIFRGIVDNQDLFDQYELNNDKDIKMFLAQAAVETNEFRSLVEYSSGRQYNNVRILGNVYSNDGPRFKGRGMLHLTGRYNYTRFKSETGHDVVKNPKLVENNHRISLESGTWYFKWRKVDEAAQKEDIVLATKRVNGGTNGLEKRRKYYEQIRNHKFTFNDSPPIEEIEDFLSEEDDDDNPFYIENHTLKSHDPKVKIEYHETRKKSSGKIDPKFLILHYTAGGSFKSDVRVLSTSKTKASAHIVIGKKGEIAQIGKFNDRLWHAGQSKWKGYNGLNSHSIGIEVTCWGYLDLLDNNFFDGSVRVRAHTGKVLNLKSEEVVLNTRHKNPRAAGTDTWERFTPDQIEIVKQIGIALMDHYSLIEAVGHDQVSPGRKSDPGPCMPDNVYSYLNGRNEDGEVIFSGNNDSEETAKDEEKFALVSGVDPDKLNFRRNPGGEVIGALPEGTRVKILKKSGNWNRVRTPAGYTGWVHGAYLRKNTIYLDII